MRTPEEVFDRIKQVRAQAIEHTRQARTLAAERRERMRVLIQKMLDC
jgi:hypothetical protein